MLLSLIDHPITFAIVSQKKIHKKMTFFEPIANTDFQYSEIVEVLNPTDFKNAISRSDVQLIDIRTCVEYQMGRIEYAKHIDFYQKTAFVEKIDKLDKKKPLYIYCLTGSRTRQAALILSQMGFEQIYDLRGGYRAWRNFYCD